jgi:membrane protein YqaA with SNARE-associated domain
VFAVAPRARPAHNAARQMDLDFAKDLGVYGGTFIVCFLAGLIPFINAEVWLLLVVTTMIASPAPLPAVVVLAAAGQMVAKVLLFYAARGAIAVPTGRYKVAIEKARTKVEAWRGKPKWVLWASSTLGLPPFYVISLLAGVLDIRLRTFCMIGMAGRVMRFGVIVALMWFGTAG